MAINSNGDGYLYVLNDIDNAVKYSQKYLTLSKQYQSYENGFLAHGVHVVVSY